MTSSFDVFQDFGARTDALMPDLTSACESGSFNLTLLERIATMYNEFSYRKTEAMMQGILTPERHQELSQIEARITDCYRTIIAGHHLECLYQPSMTLADPHRST